MAKANPGSKLLKVLTLSKELGKEMKLGFHTANRLPKCPVRSSLGYLS